MPREWFASRRIGPGIWVIQEPIGRAAPTFDVSTVNQYLIEGAERAALIDSGMGIADVLAVCRTLTQRPLINLCSHSHWDHVGGSHQFADRRIHAAEVARLDEDFDVAGVTHFRAAPATGTLAEGDEVDLGGRTLHIWHTPGHSPGHVSALDTTSGWLFCSDTCYAGTMWMQTEDADIALWRHSLGRIDAADEITALCVGHEEPLQERALAGAALSALDDALAGRSAWEPFAADPGSRKHRFSTFSLLLREDAR